ncbi:MAG: PDZ domain-containing protein [Gemmatimonadaceae bacterium]|nr:PDZ domain-containing protein [Gemmatimonadaceae bacterium]
MRLIRRTATLAAALAAPSLLAAQEMRVLELPRAFQRVAVSENRPRLGVTIESISDRADTLGLRIASVNKGSPAEKAGLKEGDRLQAVNGVSLRADRADAGEDDTTPLLTRRLQRELARVKDGESVSLRVWSRGQSKTLSVVPSTSTGESDVASGSWRAVPTERAVFGMSIASTGTARDTIGVFVQSVVEDGPAANAGIIEGDRIAAINGVSVRVAREDVEDDEAGSARAERLAREIGKLKVGESAELTVVGAGRSRTVRVTAVSSRELPGGEMQAFSFEMLPRVPAPRAPRAVIRTQRPTIL